MLKNFPATWSIHYRIFLNTHFPWKVISLKYKLKWGSLIINISKWNYQLDARLNFSFLDKKSKYVVVVLITIVGFNKLFCNHIPCFGRCSGCDSVGCYYPSRFFIVSHRMRNTSTRTWIYRDFSVTGFVKFGYGACLHSGIGKNEFYLLHFLIFHHDC